MKTKIKPDPIHDLFEDDRKSGEILVARFRLIIIFILIPIIFPLRFLLGYLQPSYWMLSILKWILMSSVAMTIYYILKKGFFKSWLGLLTLFLDVAFVTISIITLSFYTLTYTGSMQDPLFIILYLISLSGGIRYDYRYSIFAILLSGSMMVMLALFDSTYHQIPINFIMLTDRLAFLFLITLIGLMFTRMIKGYTFSRYLMSEKHITEISSLLEIGRKISSRDNLARILTNIAGETKKLLQADLSCIILINSITGKLDITFDTARANAEDPEQFEYLIGNQIIKTGKPLTIHSDVQKSDVDSAIVTSMGKELLRSITAIPVSVDGTTVGAILSAHKEKKLYTESDIALLGVLSQQAAISFKNSNLLNELKDESVYLQEELDYSSGFHNIVGQSEKMKEIFSIIKKAASSTIPVLIRGESGTGKELIADALYDLSSRSDKPFIKLNCAAIPAGLLESELFGHEKGSFTGADRKHLGKFELANDGTIFLDEIGDMSKDLQTKLLRVIQEGEFERVGAESPIRVDVRLITATNQDLERKIGQQEFREDLFYRINGLPIYLPPLRERREDIPLLANHFIGKYDNTGTRNIEFTLSAMRFLTTQEWKGNVRELDNLIHRMLIINDSDSISEKELQSIYTITDTSRIMDFYSTLKSFIEETVRNGCDISVEIERIEKQFLIESLNKSNGNISKAAENISLAKSTMFNKLQRYKISHTGSK